MKKLWLASLLLACLTLAAPALAVWEEPGGSPPGSNAPAPINVSNAGQVKTGGLAIGATLRALTKMLIGGAQNETVSGTLKLDVEGDLGAQRYCDDEGNNCHPIADLIGGTGGTPTTLNAGTGITLSPNQIITSVTSAGTISANLTAVQKRVTATCAAGSAIRVINQDGTVACETDDVGAPGGLSGSGSINRVAFWTNPTTLSYNNALYWDNATEQLSIGKDPPAPTPGARLDVSGLIVGNSDLYLNKPDSTDGPFIGTTINAPVRLGANNKEGLRIATNGNVGIGTTNPQRTLHISSTPSSPNVNFIIENISSEVNKRKKYITSNGGALTFGKFTDGMVATEHMRITDSGSVGIGTNSPGSRLHVIGDAQITGNVHTNDVNVHGDLVMDGTGTASLMVANTGMNPGVACTEAGKLGLCNGNVFCVCSASYNPPSSNLFWRTPF